MSARLSNEEVNINIVDMSKDALGGVPIADCHTTTEARKAKRRGALLSGSW